MERVAGCDRKVFDLPDGRRLEVYVDPDTSGRPLVFHHGTPGTGRPLTPLVEAARGQGLRWISITRPGFGPSSRLPGRQVVDVAGDTGVVLDRLRVDTCLVAGWSGGGPHALACGAVLTDRVVGVLVIAGLAPHGAAGLDWFAGMTPDDVAEAQAAIAGPDDLRRLIEPRAEWYGHASGADLLAAVAGRLSDRDATAVAPIADDLVTRFAEAASGPGWIDDWLALVAPWGFDLATLRAPTTLWHGDGDLSCPLAHARWMATRIPCARLVVRPGEGHLSIGFGQAHEMFAALVDTGWS